MTRSIVAAILEQAVEDWKALDYGERASKVFTGQVIHREELLKFFRSEEFVAMANYLSIRPNAARIALRIDNANNNHKTVKNLNGLEVHTLKTFDDCQMNISRASEKLRCSRKTAYNRMREILNKTGINPLEYAGLQELLNGCEKI